MSLPSEAHEAHEEHGGPEEVMATASDALAAPVAPTCILCAREARTRAVWHGGDFAVCGCAAAGATVCFDCMRVHVARRRDSTCPVCNRNGVNTVIRQSWQGADAEGASVWRMEAELAVVPVRRTHGVPAAAYEADVDGDGDSDEDATEAHCAAETAAVEAWHDTEDAAEDDADDYEGSDGEMGQSLGSYDSFSVQSDESTESDRDFIVPDDHPSLEGCYDRATIEDAMRETIAAVCSARVR